MQHTTDPPRFGNLQLTEEQFLQTNKAGKRIQATTLDLLPQDLHTLDHYCKRLSLTRYRMPDAEALLPILAKMGFHLLQTKEGMREAAYCVGKTLIEKYKDKGNATGRAATLRDVGVLATQVADLWQVKVGVAARQEDAQEGDGEGGIHDHAADTGRQHHHQHHHTPTTPRQPSREHTPRRSPHSPHSVPVGQETDLAAMYLQKHRRYDDKAREARERIERRREVIGALVGEMERCMRDMVIYDED